MPYLYYFLCLTLLWSCGGRTAKPKDGEAQTVASAPRTETKYVNSLKVVSPQKNRTYSYNEELTVAFESKDRFPIDSAVVSLDGKRIATLPAGRKGFTYRIPEGRTGTHTVKVEAWHPDNKRGSASVSFRVKPDKAPQAYTYRVEKSFPHDPKAYTQGLIYQDGYMYEGTGQYGESSIRKTDMKTGQVLAVLNIDRQLFGEGITIYKDKIYQITWRSRKGFIYDLKTFSPESTFQYNSEGWGITTYGDRLIMSDGSNRLYHVSPSSFNIVKQVEVYDHNGPVDQLNELEYVDGLVWANVWLTDRIVAIDPETGAVKGEVDMGQLLSPAEKAQLDERDEVLNGIAWNAEKGTFYLTGKRWPKLFEVRIRKE